jgi:hypothetical protein
MSQPDQKYWPYHVAVMHTGRPERPRDTDAEIMAWCQDNIGEYQKDWTIIYFIDGTVIYLTREQDVTLFSLRWL